MLLSIILLEGKLFIQKMFSFFLFFFEHVLCPNTILGTEDAVNFLLLVLAFWGRVGKGRERGKYVHAYI